MRITMPTAKALSVLFLLSALVVAVLLVEPSNALKAKTVFLKHHHKKAPPPSTTQSNSTDPILLPKDCLGVRGGEAAIDDCGTCSTPERWNLACADCKGAPNGKAREDKCGVCQGQNACVDCHGIAFGKGKLDRCDVCDGNGKSCIGCDGVLFSGKTVDKCQICGGNDSCVDCNGVPHGFDRFDRCGKCGGNGECVGCDGVPFSGLTKDLCGLCGGDGSSCSGCDGIPGSGILWDSCGVCGGNNSTCCSLSPFALGGAAARKKNGLKNKLDGLLSLGAAATKKTTATRKAGLLCSGHGWCDPDIRGCSCDSGWTGPYCQKKQTLCRRRGDAAVCSGRGACDQDTGLCACKAGWTGFSCDISLCWGNGAFDPLTQACVCYGGYAGEFCDRCGQPAVSRKQYVCVPRSYSWPTSMAANADARQTEEASRTYDLIVLPKSRVVALLHKKKSTERAFLPNSTLDSGGHIDCACRLNHTAPKVAAAKDERGTEKKAGATLAAHAMVWDVMEMHAGNVKRSADQLQAANDMNDASDGGTTTAINICIASSSLAWVIALATMGVVLLVGLVFLRAQSGGLSAGFATVSGRFRRRR